MKKPIRLFLCVLLAFAILIPVFPAAFTAGAADQEERPLSVKISYDKASYSLTATAKINVILTNTGSRTLWSVKAVNMLPASLTAYGKAPLSASAERLKPGETMQIAFEARLNPNTANVNFFAKILLNFLNLFKEYGGLKKVTNEETIDINDSTHEYFDTSKTVLFGNITVEHTVRAAYSTTLIAPVGGTAAQITSFYNEFANGAKAYGGTVKVTKKSGTVSVVNTIAEGFLYRNYLENALPDDYGYKPTLTFVNGIYGSTTLIKYLPRSGEEKTSILEPGGVKAATCVKDGTVYKVSITLKEEALSDLNTAPVYHSQCIDPVLIPADKFMPFRLGTATVTYSDRSTITATIDEQGLLTSLNITEPVHTVGDVYYNNVLLPGTDFTCTFRQEFTFTYLA